MSPRHAGWATRSPAWESQGQCPRPFGIMSRTFQIGQIESTWRGSESSSRGANRNSVADECRIAWPSRTSSRLRSPWYSLDSPGKRISGATDSEAESTQAPVEKVPSDRWQAGRNVHHHPEHGDRVDRQRGKDGRPVQVGREGAARRVDLYMLSRISDTRNGMFAIGTCQEGSSR